MACIKFIAALVGFILLAVPTSAFAQRTNHVIGLNSGVLSNDYLTISTKVGLLSLSGITVEAWVYPSSYANFPTIVGNSYRESYWFGLDTGGHPRFYPRGGTFFSAPVIVPLNSWTHLAATYDGTTARIFVNGDQVASSTAFSGSIPDSYGDLRIGADREGSTPSYFWRGYLDEIRIWNVARTSSQLKQTMYAGAGYSSTTESAYYTGLKMNFSLDRVELGDRFWDSMWSSRKATFVNTPAWLDAPSPPLVYNTGLALSGIQTYWKGLPLTQELLDGFATGLTLMGWIAPSSTTGGDRAIVAKNWQTSFYLGLSGSGHLRFYPTGGFGRYVESAATIPSGKWTHVAATYAGGISKLYINGALDSQWTTVTGPVGMNSDLIYFGADRMGTTTNYFFAGFLDEVRIIGGLLETAQIRAEMMTGGWDATRDYEDWRGHQVLGKDYSFDLRTSGGLVGTGGRFVRSGAPLWGYESPLYGVVNANDFDSAISPSSQILPDGTPISGFNSNLGIAAANVISGVDCFVVMSCTDNSNVSLWLRSPSGRTVPLVNPGTARGRDFATVFDDGSSKSVFSDNAPYLSGVRPSGRLSDFNGESSAGTWTLIAATTGSARVSLWSWGVRITPSASMAVSRATSDLAFATESAGGARGTASLRFSLPHDANVRLDLYDVQGRRKRELLSGQRGPGEYHVGCSTAGLPAGVYFARLEAEGIGQRSVRVVVVP